MSRCHDEILQCSRSNLDVFLVHYAHHRTLDNGSISKMEYVSNIRTYVTNACTHTHTSSHLSARAHRLTHILKHRCAHARAHMCARARARAHTHTHTHTHRHTHSKCYLYLVHFGFMEAKVITIVS